jgi:ABC-type transporter Mla subunit MlaD
MAENLYKDLQTALQDFQKFLDDNTDKIVPAFQALKSVIPQLGDLVDKLITLLGKLKTEIQNLDVGAGQVGDAIKKVSEFTGGVKTLLTTAENLLPQDKADIDSVLSVVDVVSSLPSLNDVKDAILKAIDAIVVHLNKLK